MSYRYAMIGNIYFGAGVSKTTGAIVKDEGLKRVLVVTDRFLYDNGIIKGILDSLDENEIEYKVFADVRPNPLLSNVMSCLELIREIDAEGCIGIGGGSAIDCCKGAAMLSTNPLPRDQYIGKDLVPNYSLPFFTIPTTAGTGSECTSGSIIVDDATGKKAGVLSKKVLSRAAIVDPELVASLPQNQTAATGMDALIHAVEAYTNINATELSDMWSWEAIKLISRSIRQAYLKGSDMDARSDMSLGAACAGMALLGAGCAGCHCLAYSIENKYHIVHGMANASMMPYVTRFNAVAKAAKYKKVAEALGENVEGLSDYEAALKAADAFEKLNELFKIPKISGYDVTEEDIEAFADEAMANKRLRPQNPRTLTKEDIIKIYKEAL
ncbi:MAG: iron-containing alcohol dehydrogenase [Lachnospiraceae bacterium]|nr:iron-containing alcohol dehydrogenase [Lachnospiraceae bacterium]